VFKYVFKRIALKAPPPKQMGNAHHAHKPETVKPIQTLKADYSKLTPRSRKRAQRLRGNKKHTKTKFA
jgi:hypothetical protein